MHETEWSGLRGAGGWGHERSGRDRNSPSRRSPAARQRPRHQRLNYRTRIDGVNAARCPSYVPPPAPPMDARRCHEGEGPVKKLEAIIDPVSLHEVRQALEAIGLTDLILSDVRGSDQHGAH